jgi:hypothetical protein
MIQYDRDLSRQAFPGRNKHPNMHAMILVFKTSVDSAIKVEMVKPHLDQITSIHRWNFDLWDCDKILRIDGPAGISPMVIRTLNKQGFKCVEL